ncbi:MAG: arginase family protein [Gemmatimonadota bacterium]
MPFDGQPPGRRTPAPIAVIGAPSSIGIRPYDDGTARGLDQAPGVFRELRLLERLGAEDRGDVRPPPYRDFEFARGSPRNEPEVAEYSRALAERVAVEVRTGRFPLVLGGDCSTVLGSLLGLRDRAPVGLAYVDGHCDFALPSFSTTGSVAGMALAFAVGRGDGPLVRLAGPEPLVQESDTVVIGRRDEFEEPFYGRHSVRYSDILDIPCERIAREGVAEAAASALERLARSGLAGFWIHLDADTLDPAVMPAVDSPDPGGMRLDELGELVGKLARHPKSLGLNLTIYDPVLDPDRSCARRLVELLARALGPSSVSAPRG